MSEDLGLVEVLGAEAVGQPGQRRFRLFVQSVRGSAILWMEKEQLNSLSLGLDRFLAQLTQGQVLRTEARAGARPAVQGMPTYFPRTPSFEFQVGQLTINYNERTETFLLSAVPLEIRMEQGLEPQVLMHEDEAVSFTFTHQQAQELSMTITTVVSAGRPLCPFCYTPLDGGPHACVKQNGHREIIQIEDDEGSEE